MNWFKSVEKYRLQVKNPTLKAFLLQKYDTSHCLRSVVRGQFSRELHEALWLNGVGDELQALLKNTSIDGDWEKYASFLWQMYEKKFSVIYRGVERYNWFSLRRIARYGNDRNTADGRKIFPQSPTKKSPNEAIWATTFEGKAWEYSVRELRNKYVAHPEKAKGKALLLLYNEKQLVQTGDYGFEWEIREGLSFRDALLAIVIVEFV